MDIFKRGLYELYTTPDEIDQNCQKRLNLDVALYHHNLVYRDMLESAINKE